MRGPVVLYTHPMSRGRIALWMLEETGVAYTLQVVDLMRGEHKRPAFLALNPLGKLPVLQDGDVVVSETGAICAYLADAFPAAGLAPAIGDAQRGAYLKWMFFAYSCVEPAIGERMFGWPPVARKGAVGYGSHEDTIGLLESALHGGPYLLGQRFCAADVVIGSQIGWAIMVKALSPRPAFTSYLDRLHARPAFRRAMARNHQMLEEQAKPSA